MMIQSQRFYNWLRVFLTAFLLASSVPSAMNAQRPAAANHPVFRHVIIASGLRHHRPQMARSLSRTADLEQGDPAEYDVRTAAVVRLDLRPSVSTRLRHVSWLPLTDWGDSRVSASLPTSGVIHLDSIVPLAARPLVSGCGPRAPPSVILTT